VTGNFNQLFPRPVWIGEQRPQWCGRDGAMWPASKKLDKCSQYTRIRVYTHTHTHTHTHRWPAHQCAVTGWASGLLTASARDDRVIHQQQTTTTTSCFWNIVLTKFILDL